jgi:hypothetical protein
MTSVTTKPEPSHSTIESNSHLFDGWFDPIETGIRDRVRGLIEACGVSDALQHSQSRGEMVRHP